MSPGSLTASEVWGGVSPSLCLSGGLHFCCIALPRRTGWALAQEAAPQGPAHTWMLSHHVLLPERSSTDLLLGPKKRGEGSSSGEPQGCQAMSVKMTLKVRVHRKRQPGREKKAWQSAEATPRASVFLTEEALTHSCLLSLQK